MQFVILVLGFMIFSRLFEGRTLQQCGAGAGACLKYSSRMAIYQRLKYLKNKFIRISHPDTDWKAKADSAFTD